ncbi:type IV secretion system protein VirB10 [Rhodobium orientis]|uniref:Conjugal transfer protein TraI n=1 Tax=Rhodobium orientis TaxID=34017 RepID=A0A327JKF6_9HYPH|nr:TrbI/VirB10 family protein [Rhodobium orientis]MBB4303155.1 type IV secretion system protein VirB10 [Rhodobium orientis]MBK5951743.1 conjugal transfer protein TraI [Rhodobium orientis]RAI26920.1 conjugal transfer protein TraI [Rhodobium orientis]
MNDDKHAKPEPKFTSAPTDAAAAMRLRAKPPQVTRLSRRTLAAVGLIVSLGIGGALIYALRPPGSQTAGEELYTTDNRRTAEGLEDLPRDYAGPILGPPLPGDLGRPILNAKERGQPVTPPVVAPPATDPEQQRRLAEAEAARTSRVFFQTGTTSPTTPNRPPDPAAPGSLGLGLTRQASATTTQDRQLSFLNAPADRRTVAPDRVMPTASPYVLQAGSVIPAALITGIRSDLPGQITAQVTQHIYDSPSGQILLIPQGTRIIGEYSNDVGFGQRRVLLVWNRLIFPNGRSIVLERQPGTDTEGFAGLEDGVDHHWWDLAKAAGLSTLLAVGAELTMDDDDRLVQAIRNGAQDTTNDAGQQIIQRQLQVAPTLTIRPGFPVRVIVTHDLVLEPYQG